MYGAVLGAHSWLRWAVLLLGIAALFQLVRQAARSAPEAATPLYTLFIRLLGLQFLLGMVLYGLLSPYVRAGWSDWASALADPTLRFFTIEHPFGMFFAVGAAHFGWIRLGRDLRWHRAACVAQAVWLVLTLASIPWPFLAYGRDLFRL